MDRQLRASMRAKERATVCYYMRTNKRAHSRRQEKRMGSGTRASACARARARISFSRGWVQGRLQACVKGGMQL
eukprot:5365679-Pleurochrysis_carterae.AAC.1